MKTHTHIYKHRGNGLIKRKSIPTLLVLFITLELLRCGEVVVSSWIIQIMKVGLTFILMVE